jgi:hypothetical protein
MTRLRQLRKAYNVEAAHIYELMDETYWAPSGEAFMGLVGLVEDGQGGWKPGERKAAFAAAKDQVADSGAWAGRDSDCYLNPHNRLSSTASMQISYAYCLVLERAVDGAGFKGWMEALQKDTKVPELLLAMLGSAEFNSKHTARDLSNAGFVRLLYRLLLNREPDDAGRSAYLPRLETGSLTRSRLAAAIVDSAEFRQRHPILFPSANDRGH